MSTTILLVNRWRADPSIGPNFTAWETIVANDGAFDFEKESNAIPVVSTEQVQPGIPDLTNVPVKVYDINGVRLGTFINRVPELNWDGIAGDKKVRPGLYLLLTSTGVTGKIFIHE